MPKISIRENEPYQKNGIWVRGPEEEHTWDEQKIYGKVRVEQGDSVVDIGGHIGCTARWFIERGAGKVYSFEPIVDNFEMLIKNSVGYPIFPIRCAVVAENVEETTLYTPNTRFTTTHSILQKRGRTATIVPAVGFYEVICAYRPQVLKIDAEGAELTFLETFEVLHNHVRSLVMEVHFFTPDARDKAKQLKEILSAKYEEVQPMKYLDSGWHQTIGVWERK